LKVFTELSTAECQDYPTLRAALLNAYAVVPEVYRKRFRALTKSSAETYAEFVFRLSMQFRRWLESEEAYDDVSRLRELCQLEQFNSILDNDIRIRILDQKPKTVSEAARIADQYVAVRKAGPSEQKISVPNWKQKFVSSGPRDRATIPSSTSTTYNREIKSDASRSASDFRPESKSQHGAALARTAPVICYYCKKPGHTLAVCRKRLAKLTSSSSDAPVQLVSVVSQASPVDSMASLSCVNNPVKDVVPDPRFNRHCVYAELIRPDRSRRQVRVLRDTGALQSLLCSSVVSDVDYRNTGEQRLIRGVTGDVVAVPLVEVTLRSSLCDGTFLCGLVSTLPAGIAALIGNDLCPDDPVSDVAVVTRAQAARMLEESRAANEPADLSVPDPVDTEANSVHISDNDGDDPTSNLSSLFENNLADASNSFAVDRPELIRLQQADTDLVKLFDLVDKPDSPYVLRSGVLVRNWRDKLSPQEATIHQVVVPVALRAKLLHIAHDIPAAGHLGVAKTRDRLLRHFYWPSLTRDTKDYCRSCDTCQRLGKGAPPLQAPLHSLPIVSEPFSQIAIDIVGPLPICSSTGSRFILTVLDLCTHYPEAIPLKQHTARDVAQALSQVFSHFGFPQEIVSDQGTDFMSELMQIFLNDFSINHIRTSIYHPQTNGACERFNRTMKTMIKALTEKFPDSWDTALPWILFAYREVPVETLGLSPFDLLFGRSVAGPLSLLKSTLLQETDLQSAKQNVVDFILDTRERLRHAVDLANEHAACERSKSKLWYDKRACLRTFEPGDRVLVLLPVAGKPFQAKYHGP
jgi:Integrase zinc binding domain/SCAN domain/Integrase core domain